MENIVSLIFQGCQLVKDLEASLPILIANQHHHLVNSCDEITRIFDEIREQLEAAYGHHEPPLQVEAGGSGGMPEWLRMESIQHPQHGDGGQYSDGGVVVAEVANLCRVSPRQRTRKEGKNIETIRISTPKIGNKEVSPEDGYSWRKYGQKEILGSKYPRGYYRCTYQKLYNCPAKKQVQRLDYDPYTFEVTYLGDHTCTMSLIDQSMQPSSKVVPTQSLQHQPTPMTYVHTNQSSMDVLSSNEFNSPRTNNIDPMDIHGSRSGGANSSEPRLSSTTTYIDYPAVIDLASTIFNSDNGSNNSLDIIFPSTEKKWESGSQNN